MVRKMSKNVPLPNILFKDSTVCMTTNLKPQSKTSAAALFLSDVAFLVSHWAGFMFPSYVMVDAWSIISCSAFLLFHVIKNIWNLLQTFLFKFESFLFIFVIRESVSFPVSLFIPNKTSANQHGDIKLSWCSSLITVLHLFSDSKKWYSENCNYNV